MIVKRGDKWIIKSGDGKKILGEFTSKTEAIKRLQQIEFYKKKGKVG